MSGGKARIGRPPIAPEDRRVARLSAACTDAELRAVARWAAWLGKTPSQLIRDRVLPYALDWVKDNPGKDET